MQQNHVTFLTLCLHNGKLRVLKDQCIVFNVFNDWLKLCLLVHNDYKEGGKLNIKLPD